MPTFIEISLAPLGLIVAGSAAISALLTWLIRRFAIAHSLFDLPASRRVHTSPTPRLGGVAIYIVSLVGIILLFGFSAKLLGIYLGLTIIFALGLIDDLLSLPAPVKLGGQLLAASCLVVFGITILAITNPFGGMVLLPPLVDVFLTLLWVAILVNTFNFIDGLDGLAGSVASVASLTMIGLSLLATVNQPDTAALSAVVLGASLGFLAFNWHPAKIFMGDSGSHTLGFLIATIAIISGGKLATAALVLTVPLLDLVWAVARRLASGQSPFVADRAHLHHRLLDLGIAQPKIVGMVIAGSALLGLAAILAGTAGKVIILGIVVAVGAVLGYRQLLIRRGK